MGVGRGGRRGFTVSRGLCRLMGANKRPRREPTTGFYACRPRGFFQDDDTSPGILSYQPSANTVVEPKC